MLIKMCDKGPHGKCPLRKIVKGTLFPRINVKNIIKFGFVLE
jgi:hypothetical protein